MAFLPEAEVEQALLAQLQALGFEREANIGPDGRRSERESYSDVVLKNRLEVAVARLNPGLPDEAQQEAVRRVLQSELPALLEENRRFPKLISGELRVSDAQTFLKEETP